MLLILKSYYFVYLIFNKVCSDSGWWDIHFGKETAMRGIWPCLGLYSFTFQSYNLPKSVKQSKGPGCVSWLASLGENKEEKEWYEFLRESLFSLLNLLSGLAAVVKVENGVCESVSR